MATYTQNTRLTQPTSGSLPGTWGTTANEIFEHIDASLGSVAYASPDTDSGISIPDGGASDARSLLIEVTGALTATRTITLGPNTSKKVWIVRNSTTGAQSITIAQGSGSTVTIPNGYTAVVYGDGAGSTAAVENALDKLLVTNLQGTVSTATQATISHDSLADFVANEHINHTSVSVSTGTGLSGGGDITTTRTIELDLDNLAEKTGNLVAGDRLVGVSGTTHFAETISNIPLSIFNNDIGVGGSVSSVDINDGTGFTVSGGPITTSGAFTITMRLDEFSEKAGAVAGTDRLVGVSGTTQFAETISGIPLSIFNNDAGWTTNVGTVTEVTVNTGLAVATATSTPDLSLSLNSIAEKTGNLVGGDRLVGVSGTTHFAETISAIPLSIFTNDTPFLSGTVAVTSGGTGLTTLGDVGRLIVSTSTTAFTTLDSGSAGNFVRSNGTTWVASTLTTTDFQQAVVVGPTSALGNSTASKTIDLSTANVFTITNSAACTVTLSNPTSGGSWAIIIDATTGANSDWVWPGTVVWKDGTEPALTTTAGVKDVVYLLYDGAEYVASYTQGH